MRTGAQFLCAIMALGTILGGCKQSEPAEERKAGEAPKRTPKLATMYVESKGEALNTGEKKVEKSDEGGSAKGGFSPKDLLMPGMFVLVSGATALGGPLLIKALDKKDRPSEPVKIAGGGADGTFVPVETSGEATAAPTSGEPGGPAVPVAPDPGAVTAVAKSEPTLSSKTLATGRGVASTPTSILMSMGYASDFSGPSYITGTMTSTGKEMFKGVENHIYSWKLTVDKTTAPRSGTVDVYATFSGLKSGDLVTVILSVTGEATFTCDHVPLVSIPPIKEFKDEWYIHEIPHAGTPPLNLYSLTFRLPAPDVPIRLGFLKVEGETDIVGESTAEVTVH